MTMTIDGSPYEIELVKTHALAKLNQRRTPPLVNLNPQQLEIQSLLENTIVNHEGNSCIIMGPRSTGKTTLVDTTLHNLQAKYPDQFVVVKLSGFAQSDDKMALREMTRQLDNILFNGTISEFEGLEKKSMSETLESLLAVLSGNNDDKSRVSVIIVLDELDRFALNTRQTLLYNVLDISQTSPVGVAVVGITARMNTREILEKRVRSRFSQRIYQIRRPLSLQQFWEVCRTNITVDEDALRGELNFSFARDWNEHIDVSTP
jgi:origin recognition complex subunit 4